MSFQREAMLAELMTDALPSVFVLFVLKAIVLLAFFAFTGFGTYISLRRPVLEQLQGGAKKSSKRAAKTPRASAKASRVHRGPPELTFILRHIFRTPAKSILIFATALIFVVALGLLAETIRNSEEEIDRLFATTIVEAEILRSSEDMERRTRLLFDVVPRRTYDFVFDTSFVQHAFIEAGHGFAFVLPPAGDGSFPDDVLANLVIARDDDIPGGGETRVFMQTHFDFLFATNNLRHFTEDGEGFLSRMTDTPQTLANMQINFAQGFGEVDFVYDGGDIPIIISQRISMERGVNLGDTVFIALVNNTPYMDYLFDTRHSGVPPAWQYVRATVIGMHDNAALLPLMQHSAIMPLDALESIFGPDLGYITFRFTINPDYNRDWQAVTNVLTRSLWPIHPWFNTIELVVHDNELRFVAEPMEQNLSLLRLLYPIAIAISAIIGIGLSILLMLQSAKNAAIMAVLGMPRHKSRIILWLKPMLVGLLGTIFGMLMLAAITAAIGLPLLIAAIPYTAGAIIGNVIAVVLITNRAPLDLLQVKE